MTPCDGCSSLTPYVALSYRRDGGHECRYCADCDAEYVKWENVCNAEVGRLNALADAFVAESRRQIPLRLVPRDLPSIPGLIKDLLA